MLRSKKSMLIALALFLGACSFFSPQEPEAFGEVQINLQLPAEGPSPNGAASFTQKKSAVLERVLIILYAFDNDQNPRGRELARRDLLIGNERTLRTAVRVPLRAGSENCFVAEVSIFDHTDLLYSGQGFPCFALGEKNASAEITLQAAAFDVFQPFAPITPTNTRLVTMGVQLRDSTITHFEIITDSVRALVPAAGRRAGLITTQTFVLGDTTNVKIRAWRNLDFKGEVNRRFVYGGPKSDVLIAMTWNSTSNFDLEVINPAQRAVSVLAQGDSVGGSGLLILGNAAGYGPEIFEWRQSPRLNQGTFTINARRSVGSLVGAGVVYVYLREGQATQNLSIVPFSFTLLDTPLFKQVHTFAWP